MTAFEITQVVTNAIAIFLSILSLICSASISNKQKKLNMKEHYYQPVFQELLLVTFPETFTNFINIKNKKYYINASTDFEQTIGLFRKKIKFLQFADYDAYNKIDDLLIQIDECVVLLCSNKENKEEKILNIHNLVKKLYEEINKYYN